MTQTTDLALEVDNLVVRYGHVTAVNGVSFHVRSGSVMVILGRNGAGKTSTIEVCEGFRPPTSGRVRVLGFDPTTQRAQLNRHMGVMLQGGGIYPSARVGETIDHYCSLYGSKTDPTDIIERVGLEHLQKHSWKTLSGGEKQRLSLALALCASPRIAFLDEPTAGVDLDGRHAIRAIIRDLAAGGCAVILATHEMDEAERCADDVLIIDAGKVMAHGALSDLRKPEIRFRLSAPVPTLAMAEALGFPVVAEGDEYVVIGSSDASDIAIIARIADEHAASVVDVRAGSQRLETLFRDFTDGAHT
jgi:ABC-2 type transport system ATP-binding protein